MESEIWIVTNDDLRDELSRIALSCFAKSTTAAERNGKCLFTGEKINFEPARVGAAFCYTSKTFAFSLFTSCHMIFFVVMCLPMSEIVNKVVKENTRNCALEARKTILPTINLHFSWTSFTLTVCSATCWKLKRHLGEIAGWRDLEAKHPPFGVLHTFFGTWLQDLPWL